MSITKDPEGRCYSKDRRKFLKCKCLHNFLHESNDKIELAIQLDELQRLWSEFQGNHGKTSQDTDLQRPMPEGKWDQEMFLKICSVVETKINAGAGGGRTQFYLLRFPQYPFCATALQNLFGYDLLFRKQYLNKLHDNKEIRERLISLSVLQGLMALKIEQPQYATQLRRTEIFNRMSKKNNHAVNYWTFDRHFFRPIQSFLDRDDVIIAEPKLLQDHKTLSQVVGKHAAKDIVPHLVHTDNPQVFKVLDLNFINNICTRFVDILGVDGSSGMQTVDGVNWLKYISTPPVDNPMVSLIANHLNKPGKTGSTPDPLLHPAHQFDLFLKGLVEDQLGCHPSCSKISIIASAMLSQYFPFTTNAPPNLHDLQTPHLPLRRIHHSTQAHSIHKMWVAVMPLEKAGMVLSYYTTYDSSSNGATLVLVPFGNIVFLPASLVQAGGFRSSLTGNKRCQFIVISETLELISDCCEPPRQLGAHSFSDNYYLSLNKAPSRTTATFRRDSNLYRGIIKEFDLRFQI